MNCIITRETTVEEIIEFFDKLGNNKILLDIKPNHFIKSNIFIVFIVLFKNKKELNKDLLIELTNPENHQYAQRMNFYKELGIETCENFSRHDQHTSLIEITQFDENGAITVVNDIMSILKTQMEIEESVYKCLNYCFAEITDNVYNHSKSKINGYVVVQYYKAKNLLSIVIADAGIGMSESIKQKKEYNNFPEAKAIEICFNEGVTDGYGRGNGLYHTKKFIEKNLGEIDVYSKNTKITFTKNELPKSKKIRHFQGSMIELKINTLNSVIDKEIFGENIPTSVEEADSVITGLW